MEVSNIDSVDKDTGSSSFESLIEGSEDRKLRDSYILVSDQETESGRIKAGYTVIFPECRTNGHSHDEFEEIYYITKGSGEMVIGEEEFEVEAGDSFYVPFGKWHATINKSREPLEYFWVLSRNDA